MPDPLRMPEAVREAVRGALPWLIPPLSEDADAIARAVLTAALKSEWEGPHAIERCEIKGVDGPVVWWTVNCPDGYRIVVQSESEARAVAAALNITQGGER